MNFKIKISSNNLQPKKNYDRYESDEYYAIYSGPRWISVGHQETTKKFMIQDKKIDTLRADLLAEIYSLTNIILSKWGTNAKYSTNIMPPYPRISDHHIPSPKPVKFDVSSDKGDDKEIDGASALILKSKKLQKIAIFMSNKLMEPLPYQIYPVVSSSAIER